MHMYDKSMFSRNAGIFIHKLNIYMKYIKYEITDSSIFLPRVYRILTFFALLMTMPQPTPILMMMTCTY